MKSVRIILLLIILFLAACAGGNQTPTPTIVRLDGTEAEPAQAEADADDAPPTATPLPLPSPTPTSTPMPATEASATNVPEPSATVTAAASPPQPETESEAQVEILAWALNVRQGPGLDFAVIKTARAEEMYPVTGVDRFGNWLRIELDDGQTGWVSAQADYTRLLNVDFDELPVVQAPASANGLAANALPGNGVQQTQTSAQDVKTASPERLVFNTGSGGDLYVINIDGTGLRHLAGGVIDPVVSPDGQQVAFTRWDGAEFGAVFVLDLDDGSERVVVGDIRQPKSPAWSPDGEQLVISFQQGGLRDPQRQCRRFRLGEEVRIPRDAEIKWAKFDPESGTFRVCFVRSEDLQWLLKQIDIATGAFEDLDSELYSYNPAWDPQNPWRVIYDGEKGLIQYDLNRNEQWPLTEDLRDTAPVFSPDGEQLALTYKQHDHWEVYTFDMQTGARARLTKPPILADPQYNSAAPDWSPDGSQIAFVTDRTGRWEIWVMDADGGNPRPLFTPEVQAQLELEYRGMNERMLNWIE